MLLTADRLQWSPRPHTCKLKKFYVIIVRCDLRPTHDELNSAGAVARAAADNELVIELAGTRASTSRAPVTAVVAAVDAEAVGDGAAAAAAVRAAADDC